MAFADAARQRTKRTGTPCSVCKAIAGAPKELAAEINEALADRTISARAIHAEMVARGLTCSDQQVARHRNGACCGRAS